MADEITGTYLEIKKEIKNLRKLYVIASEGFLLFYGPVKKMAGLSD